MCCGYGTDGKGSKVGYDCVIIPGASKVTASPMVAVPNAICGKNIGLVTGVAANKINKTVCSELFTKKITNIYYCWISLTVHLLNKFGI